MGVPLETARTGLSPVRQAVGDSTDSTLDSVTLLPWSVKPSDAYKVNRGQNNLVFRFTGSAAAIACADVEIWGYVRGASAQLLWVGGVIAGALENDDSEFEVDTITTTTDNTAQGVAIRDGAGGAGGDRVATLRFDIAECEWIVVRFPTIASGTMNCYVVGY